MPKTVITESDLSFDFDQDWVVKKYDEHAYFKLLAGCGLKGVDFIGIYQHKWLYLIEVKNYKKRRYSPVDPDWADLVGDNPDLAKDFALKISDTLRLVSVVMTYLQRQWWYKIVNRFRSFLGITKVNKDWHFWQAVANIENDPSLVIPTLYIESSKVFLERYTQTENEFLIKMSNHINTILSNPKMGTLVVISSTSSNVKDLLPGVNVSPQLTSKHKKTTFGNQ